MGCLLAEFKLTAMLFGGGRWGVLWFGCGCFLGFVPFALSTPPPSLSLPTGESGGEKHGAFLRAGIVLSGGRLIFLLGNMLPCEAE